MPWGSGADTDSRHWLPRPTRSAAADPEFAEQLRGLWRQASTELNANRGSVINQVSGIVSGNVVQAHDIHGNVTFGDVPRRDG